MQTILVGICDVQLFLFLRHILAGEGFDAALSTDAEDMSAQAATRDVVAVVLDWETQGRRRDEIRQALPGVPLILFARTGEARTEELNAQDLLLARPFDPAALIRFLSELRQRTPAAIANPNATLRCGDLHMNVAGMTVHRAGHCVRLTALQFRLLRCLLERSCLVCDREALVACCWPAGAEVELRTVDIHVGHIRRRLLQFGPDLIRTVRGTGYVLDPVTAPGTGPC